MQKEHVTINDIAREAGVSKTTVSRFLNGKYEYMSQETRKRIEQIIQSAHYRPNKLASSLKSNRSHQIGVLISDICNPISAILVRGISDVCETHGYSLTIYCTDSNLEREQEGVERLIDQRVDGILIHPSDRARSGAVFADKAMPFAVVDRTIDAPADTVTTDGREATRTALEHLYAQGFRNLALFTEEPANISTRHERIEAFSSFYRAHIGEGAEAAVHVIDIRNPGQVRESVKALAEKQAGGPLAVFTTNGNCLLGVLTAVRQLGLRIPDDLAVCGYDDWPWTELVTPGITVISQPVYQMGTEAAQLLFSRIDGGAAQTVPVHRVLRSRLVVRGSTRFVSARL